MKPELTVEERKCLISRSAAAAGERNISYVTVSKRYGIPTTMIYRHASCSVRIRGCSRTLTDEDERNCGCDVRYAHHRVPMTLENLCKAISIVVSIISASQRLLLDSEIKKPPLRFVWCILRH